MQAGNPTNARAIANRRASSGKAGALAAATAAFAIVLWGGYSQWGRHHSMIALLSSVVFAAVVLGGYLVPSGRTGFTGNTLWDWLHLLAQREHAEPRSS